MTETIIRPVRPTDKSAVITLGRELIKAGDTYAFDSQMTDEDLWHYWTVEKQAKAYVAEQDTVILGIFVIKQNQPGPAAHIANASYAVSAHARGKGIGRAMGQASLTIARDLGYHAMQFNIVIATNLAAIKLWQSLGFDIIGTIPNGFCLPSGAYADFHIMHRAL